MMDYDTTEGQSSATNVAQLLDDIEAQAQEQITRDSEIRLSELREYTQAHERFTVAPTWCISIIEHTDVWGGPKYVGDMEGETIREELRRMAAAALVDRAVDRLEDAGVYDPTTHALV